MAVFSLVVSAWTSTQDAVHVVAQAVIGERRVGRLKRIVQRVHVKQAHGMDDQNPAAARRVEDADAPSRRAGGVVHRPEEPGIAVDVIDDLAPVPDVVAGGDDVGPGVVEFLANFGRDAEAMGRVLAVDDDEIEVQPITQPGQLFLDHGAAGPPYHVAAKQHSHDDIRTPRQSATIWIAPSSVTIQSRRWSWFSSGTRSTRWAAKAMPTASTRPARRRAAKV